MGSRNRLLIGQIALELKLLSREQLQECINHQAGQVQAKPIGVLLVESGFLTPEQLTVVLEEQRRRLQETLPYAPTQRGAVAFGRLIVERGLVSQEHVNEALRAQQDLAERGIRKRLGELLVEAERLSPDAIPEVLKTQGKVLMACTFCGAHFNVLTTISEGYPCRKCGMPLDQKTGIVSADETAYLLPASDPRPREASDTRRAVVQAPAGSAPVADTALRDEMLARIAKILTLIGILTLVLYLLNKY
ncbi:MAG: hypothetical protein HY293_14730 [Planctomycetes bacterium]|nr:hypothetical protein [Planctomycetota bacterium]